jgi:hypothetical protein
MRKSWPNEGFDAGINTVDEPCAESLSTLRVEQLQSVHRRPNKKEGHVSVPFFFHVLNERIDYEFKFMPNGLFFRNKMKARTSSPVPRNSREEGSGVAISSMT